MALTDMAIRTSKPGARLVKLSDGGGLQLWITPDGAKRWRLAYRFAGGQKTLAIGVYPATGLREARDAREEAKRLLAAGQDPSLAKRLARAARATASANTFEAIARELLDKKRREAKAEGTLALSGIPGARGLLVERAGHPLIWTHTRELAEIVQTQWRVPADSRLAAAAKVGASAISARDIGVASLSLVGPERMKRPPNGPVPR
jgi:hypothetical protein